MRIYIAAPLAEKPRARAWADALREYKFNVVSTWHHDDAEIDPVAREVRGRIADLCTVEVTRADALLFLDSDAHQGRGALVEMGVAIANRTPVVWLRPGLGRSVWDGYHGCYPVETDGEAIHVLRLLLSQ